MQTSTQPANNTLFNSIKILFLAFSAVYLVACLTPLHLHFDSIRYYNIKDCIQLGCPDGSFAKTDYLPYGYTALLMFLGKFGILNAVSIVLVNCFYLFTGLYFFRKFLPYEKNPWLPSLIAVFSWVVIKFATHPLSEMQYIFFSMASLYCFHLYNEKNNYLYLGLAFALCFATILTRTVGISLAPALILGVAWKHKDSLLQIVRKNKALLLIVLLAGVAAVFFARQLKIVDYTSLLQDSMKQGLGQFLIDNLKNHFTEFTEVFINLSASKVLGFLPPSIGPALFIAMGIAFFCWFIYLLFAKWTRIPFYIRAYLLLYTIILMNWPYYDPRFWVPILPLMIYVILQTPFHRHKLLMLGGRLYLAAFIALGFAAMVYSLYVGFDKHRFAKSHASGDYRNEYEIHFFGKPQSDTATHIDQNVLDLLNKYD